MIDIEYMTDNCKSLKVSIEAIIKNPEMLMFVSDHLKTKMMCKHAVKKLSYVIIYVPNQYKTQMCDKGSFENGGTLMFVPDCYKN